MTRIQKTGTRLFNCAISLPCASKPPARGTNAPRSGTVRLHHACPCGYAGLPDRSPRIAHENTTFVRNPRPLCSPRQEQKLQGCMKIVRESSQRDPQTPITACPIEKKQAGGTPYAQHTHDPSPSRKPGAEIQALSRLPAGHLVLVYSNKSFHFSTGRNRAHATLHLGSEALATLHPVRSRRKFS